MHPTYNLGNIVARSSAVTSLSTRGLVFTVQRVRTFQTTTFIPLTGDSECVPLDAMNSLMFEAT